MSAAQELHQRPDDEAAMARVLAADREARAALEQSRRTAAHMLREARAAAKLVSARAASRVNAVRAAMARRLAARLAQLDAEERGAIAAGALDPQERARLAHAVERLAAELAGGRAPP